MAINSAAGAKVYIGPVTAAATVSAYAALTYVEIGKVETVGEFGDAASMITFTPLSGSRVEKMKGAYDSGDIAVSCAHDPLDAGQLAATAASAAKFSYAIKITLEDSADANDTDSVFYFHAKVMDAKLVIGGANDVLKRNYQLAITTALFSTLSTVVA